MDDKGCEFVDDGKNEDDDAEVADSEGCADWVDDDDNSGKDEDGVDDDKDDGNVSDEDVIDDSVEDDVDDGDSGTDEDCVEYGEDDEDCVFDGIEDGGDDDNSGTGEDVDDKVDNDINVGDEDDGDGDEGCKFADDGKDEEDVVGLLIVRVVLLGLMMRLLMRSLWLVMMMWLVV